MGMKERNPIAALLLAAVGPGLGQMYNGQLAKAIIIYLAGNVLLILGALSGMQYHFYGLFALLILGVSFYLFIMADALIVARRKKEIVLLKYNRWYFYLLFIGITVGISWATDGVIRDRLLGIRAYKIPSGSMLPTLHIGDRLIIGLHQYDEKVPGKGDIVVFEYPPDPQRDFIKRIIATEGDVIEGKSKVVYLNGQRLDEPYIQHTDPDSQTVQRDNFGPFFVPEGKVFVLGDNRDASLDSRFWGYVDTRKIRGKALYVYWAEDKTRMGMELK